jgi:hypothetical protein
MKNLFNIGWLQKYHTCFPCQKNCRKFFNNSSESINETKFTAFNLGFKVETFGLENTVIFDNCSTVIFFARKNINIFRKPEPWELLHPSPGCGLLWQRGRRSYTSGGGLLIVCNNCRIHCWVKISKAHYAPAVNDVAVVQYVCTVLVYSWFMPCMQEYTVLC